MFWVTEFVNGEKTGNAYAFHARENADRECADRRTHESSIPVEHRMTPYRDWLVVWEAD